MAKKKAATRDFCAGWFEGKANPGLLKRFIKLFEGEERGGSAIVTTVLSKKTIKRILKRGAAKELVNPTPFPKLRRSKK